MKKVEILFYVACGVLGVCLEHYVIFPWLCGK